MKAADFAHNAANITTRVRIGESLLLHLEGRYSMPSKIVETSGCGAPAPGATTREVVLRACGHEEARPAAAMTFII